jgi:predicted patatin/cPLA2 family phospholipase
MISDMIFLNSIIATELMKITENLAALRHGEEFLNSSSCLSEHKTLNEQVIEIVNKYNKTSEEIKRKEALERHILKHL